MTAPRRSARRRWVRVPPRLILTLLAIDVLIALGFLASFLSENVDMAIARHVRDGLRESGLARHLHPGLEANFPTWYSSMQWALAGAMFAIYAALPPPGLKQGRRLYLPAAGAIVLSLDEAASLHEWFGQRIDALLPGGMREGTVVSVTGIWMLILIPLAVIAALWVARLLVDHLRAAPLAASLLVIGALLFVLGAGILEFGTNLADGRPARHGVQILEEFTEMVAGTIVVWGALELVRVSGIRVSRMGPPRLPPDSRPSR
jgi:ABC-type sugar transport system permease subunit